MLNRHAGGTKHDSRIGVHIQQLCVITACANHLFALGAKVGRSGGKERLKLIGCSPEVGFLCTLLSLLLLSFLLLLCFQMGAKTPASVAK